MGTLYENILVLCQASGIKGGKMCTDLGISKGLLTDLKMGRRNGVSAKTADKIANYFGVSVSLLLGNDDYPELRYEPWGHDLVDDYNKAKTDAERKILLKNFGVDSKHISELLRLYFPYTANENPTIEHPIDDNALMFALWGDTTEMDEDDLEDVKRYAAFVRERKQKK